MAIKPPIVIMLSKLEVILSLKALVGLENCKANVSDLSLFLYISPLSIAPIMWQTRIITPILLELYILIATVPKIKRGPDVLQNDVIATACPRVIEREEYRSDVSLAPIGYPDTILIMYTYPATPPTPYNFCVMGLKYLPNIFKKLV